MKHLTTAEIEVGMDEIRQSPKDDGVLELIVRRPNEDEREVLATGKLDTEKGLIGDNWVTYGETPYFDAQIAIMNSRIIALIAQAKERWQLAGDQLYIDFDLSDENLPVGTRLEIGSAILETTPQPHNGCKKFVERFGLDAMKFVNSPVGKQFHLRGIYAKVVKSGTIRHGDLVKKFMVKDMKEIVIEMPDELYEKAMKWAEKLNISFDEFCAKGIRKLAEEQLEENKESTNA